MSKFKDSVLQIVRSVPKGKIVSYGQVSLMAGIPRAALQVGWVLHIAGDQVCWWRVINNQGRISTKCTEHFPLLQKQLLEEDGVKVSGDLKIDIKKNRWRPSLNTLKKFSLSDEHVYQIQEKFGV